MLEFKKITSNIFKRKDVNTDNFIFRCFYRGCFWILAVGSMLLSLKQYFGEHIHCVADKSLEHVINTYCFFSTTFTVIKHHGSKTVAHSGVGPVDDNDEVVHHAYYQWVPFFLFGQALLFYIPHYIWKMKERRRLSKWIQEPIPKEDVSDRLFIYRDWAKWLVTCEILNVLNLVLQIYLTDLFLQGKFLDLGYNYDDLDMVFPKVTKCTWRQYGRSGTIQKHDALCVIALNVINEKIFIVLWYWYILLAFLCLFGLTWRCLTFVLHRNATFNYWMFSSVGYGKRLKSAQAEKIGYCTHFSEWLLVYYLSQHMKTKDFVNLTAGLRSNIEEKVDYPDLNQTDKLDSAKYNGLTPSAPEKTKLADDGRESDC